MLRDVEIAVNNIKQSKPLILNLTHYVTIKFMANALLAIGAAPIMSICEEELEKLIKIPMDKFAYYLEQDTLYLRRVC